MKKLLLSIISLFVLTGFVRSEELIIQDFELFTVGSKLSIYSGRSATAVIAQDPKDPDNKVLHVKSSAWDAYPIVKINIPTGTLISDYDAVAFDLYRIGADNSYQQMGIYFGSTLFHKDESFVIQSPAETWTEKKYNFDGFTYKAYNYTMALGIAAINSEYYIEIGRAHV